MGLRSASPAYDVLRVVLLGAVTGIVLVHLNRTWSGAAADAGILDVLNDDVAPERRPSPPSPASSPPPAPPAKMPLAPPAPPIVDREYRTPWGYFDPQAVFGFAPLTLASLPRRFDVGTIPGIEFNPSLARLPQGIAAMLSSELGLREGTPGPVHVVLLKCMDGVCDRLRNKNRTFSGNGGFCRGSGGSVAVHCALLDENYSTVAVAQTMASFPTKDAMDVRIETHGDRIYAAHLQPHNPMRWVSRA